MKISCRFATMIICPRRGYHHSTINFSIYKILSLKERKNIYFSKNSSRRKKCGKVPQSRMKQEFLLWTKLWRKKAFSTGSREQNFSTITFFIFHRPNVENKSETWSVKMLCRFAEVFICPEENALSPLFTFHFLLTFPCRWN